MINWFLRRKTANIDSLPLALAEIQQADKVLFSLFTRYGDTIIDLVVIQEFIKQYPDKEYLVLCPRQMTPYVNELLPDIENIALNKRNIFDMFKVNNKLKKWRPDIGFNPWSNGLDSCYFLTYCKHYQCYKDFLRPDIINHYEVVRNYLLLPIQKWNINQLTLKNSYKSVLICPQSTDKDRSIPVEQINALVSSLKNSYKSEQIIIAAMDKSYFLNDCESFFFCKSASSSQQFIDLVKQSDLVITADSGPLHISLAFNKDTQAYFYSTEPEIVIKSTSNLDIILN